MVPFAVWIRSVSHTINESQFMCLFQVSGRTLYRMTGDVQRGVSTSIWSILVLADSTIVSGDNRGHVQFWDGHVGVLLSSVQQHAAEIYALAVSTDEDFVYASGADSRITCLRRVSLLQMDSGCTQRRSVRIRTMCFHYSSATRERSIVVGLALIREDVVRDYCLEDSIARCASAHLTVSVSRVLRGCCPSPPRAC